MNINEQLTTIVNSIVEEIKLRVSDEIEYVINRHVEDVVKEFDFSNIIANLAQPTIDNYVASYPIPIKDIKSNLEIQASSALTTISQNLNTVVQNTVIDIMEKADVKSVIDQELADRLAEMRFPPRSIRATAIDWEGYRLSGDHISGGIQTEFSSVGIDDRATQCQLTIMDSMVVIEAPIVTTGMEIRGDMIVKTIAADQIDIANSIVGNGIVKLSNDIVGACHASITQQGIDTNQIRNSDRILLSATELGSTVLKSSLRRVGTLENLETTGETNLSETLYAYRRRVGINTVEPAHTFEVNDGEVQFMVEKVAQNRVFIGTQRNQAVTLGANGKDNLSIDVDGSVTITDLKLGAVTISTASQTPSWSGHTGELVFNDSPRVGEPSFWCCLGGHRWAIGATITD